MGRAAAGVDCDWHRLCTRGPSLPFSSPPRSRISHPKQRSRSIFISDSSIIARRDGILKFMFRVADIRRTQVRGSGLGAGMTGRGGAGRVVGTPCLRVGVGQGRGGMGWVGPVGGKQARGVLDEMASSTAVQPLSRHHVPTCDPATIPAVGCVCRWWIPRSRPSCTHGVSAWCRLQG